MLQRVGKLVEGVGRKLLAQRAKGWTVRGLSRFAKKSFREAFRRTEGLRRMAFGGALMGMGVIMLLATLYERVKAAMQRPFEFVRTNYDQAARAWKRHPEHLDPLLRERFWPLYALALECRSQKPPYQDEDSFLELARRVLVAETTLLEGFDADGRPTRIPFRQPQKCFATPPLSRAKNAVNELRFSWYRELRDRHLGVGRRVVSHLLESSPFENYILVGLRRDVLTYIARGMKAHGSEVRLEDVVGTADECFMPEEARAARDRIRAYVGRKLSSRRTPPQHRIYLALEDGLGRVVKALIRADPEYISGLTYRPDGAGGFEPWPLGFTLRQDLDGLLAAHGPIKGPANLDLERLDKAGQQARATAEALTAFLDRHDPGRTVVRDRGDLRAVRMAAQMNDRLGKDLRQGRREPGRLLACLEEVVERQEEYDRALLELRGLYHSVWADFGLYNAFIAANFTRHARRYPEVDYDPLLFRWLMPLIGPLRRGYRRLRQRLQRRGG